MIYFLCTENLSSVFLFPLRGTSRQTTIYRLLRSLRNNSSLLEGWLDIVFPFSRSIHVSDVEFAPLDFFPVPSNCFVFSRGALHLEGGGGVAAYNLVRLKIVFFLEFLFLGRTQKEIPYLVRVCGLHFANSQCA